MNDKSNSELTETDYLEICASEDLSHMGLIQPHGCLIAVAPDGRIEAASQNTEVHIGVSPDKLLGADASDIRLPDGSTIEAKIAELAPAADRVVSCPCTKAGMPPMEMLCHHSDGLTIVEVVSLDGHDRADAIDISGDSQAIKEAPNAYAAASQMASAIRRITGYDRTMVYRFLPDTTGDIIAEDRRSNLTPYLGLRYPGSDIPENARRLYLKTPIRIVADSYASPIEVRSRNDRPCNLGLARLRSVSPYHIEYLKNMGVTATLVTSIIVDGKLWGLVACHHYSAMSVDAEIQEKCIELTNILAQRITTLMQEETIRQERSVEHKKNAFIEEVKLHESLWYTALFGQNRLIRTLDIHGNAIRIGNEIYSVGYCPPPDRIWRIFDHLSSGPTGDQKGHDAVWVCTNIKAIIGDFDGPTSGVAHVRVDTKSDISILLFRNELKREVYWGGNPDKSVVVDKANKRLTPRHSFEAWATLVTNTSEEWDYIETETLRRLAGELQSLPDDILRTPIPDQNQPSINFGDLVFDHSRSEIQTIVDDFVPEGIATIAYRISPSDAIMDGFANSSFYKFLGITRQDTEHMDAEALLDLLGLPRSVMDLASNQEKTVEFISPVSGQRMLRIRNLDLICRHSRDGGHEGLGIIYLHDETERQRIIEALDAARRQHEVNASFRTEILGGLSHELRTPLNAIIGYSELLNSVLKDDDDKPKEYAGTVLDAGRQMLELVEALLDISKIEQGVLQIEDALFDVDHELNTTIKITSEHAARHAQEIVLETQPEPIQMVGDARAFRQIFINLLSNAVKFSPHGSTIKLTTERSRMDTLLVHVEDSGPGIAPHQRMQIFEPFSQVEGVESRSRPGAGIGLSIVKAYTELHGGTVTIGDSASGGTIFTVRFPSWRIRSWQGETSHP